VWVLCTWLGRHTNTHTLSALRQITPSLSPLPPLPQLSSIIPLLEQAKNAVGSIDNAALAEVRAMQMPPEAVHDVLSAVLQVGAAAGALGTPAWLAALPILHGKG
jgi:hypothetical protein